MNAVTHLIIKLHVVAAMLPGNLVARRQEERGATQTVEVIALAAALIAILVVVGTNAGDTIATAFGGAVERLLQAIN